MVKFPNTINLTWTFNLIMRCHYINLESAKQRKQKLEKNFYEHCAHDWSLQRFSAIDTDHVDRNKIEGNIERTARACYLSHQELLSQNQNVDEPFLVLEDDARFGPSSCTVIENFLANIPELEWDIIFTDICVPDLNDMIRLIKLRYMLEQHRKINLLPLDFNFAGLTSYIVNTKSAKKIYNFLCKNTKIDIPIDLVLRDLILSQNQLKAFVIFPFATTLSMDAYQPQIIDVQDIDPIVTVWNVFRNIMWNDSNLEETQPVVNFISKLNPDARLAQLGTVLGAACGVHKKN